MFVTKEIDMVDPSTGQVLKGARVYGFKNIQNLIRQVKTSTKNPYKYIELMACPGGCFKGGGQTKVKDIDLDQLNEEYIKISQASSTLRYFFQNETALKISRLMLSNQCSIAAKHSIEYAIKPLATTDNPVFMKW